MTRNHKLSFLIRHSSTCSFFATIQFVVKCRMYLRRGNVTPELQLVLFLDKKK
jgi:hypothetical protein